MHVQTLIYNHHGNIKWTESYVYTAYSITLHFIFNEQIARLGYSVISVHIVNTVILVDFKNVEKRPSTTHDPNLNQIMIFVK